MSVRGEALIYSCSSLKQPKPASPGFSQSLCSSEVANINNVAMVYRTPNKSCAPGSSCQALRHAVAALNRLDDFNCEKIGAGFFSDVYKVTHRTTGQVMVLKMNMSFSNRPNMLREVQLMNRLSHPNILRFMGVCVHEGQLHALTEYINGGSLEQLLMNKLEDLPWADRIKLALDIARGMCYLHSRGVFHRDLTSKNVLIKTQGSDITAVVGDFGLAEKIPDPRDQNQLPVVGSPYWMAPECLQRKRYDEKADVFSFGIILCEIIARIEADPDILPRTRNFGVDYVAFSKMCPDCPPSFLHLAFTCCGIDPASRPTFKELVTQLEAILANITSLSGNDQPITSPVITCLSSAGSDDSIDSVRAIFDYPWARLDTSSAKDSSESKLESIRKPMEESVKQQQTVPVTPKHIGEAMSLKDPHYRPCSSSQNPFASLPRCWNRRKILEPAASDPELAHSCNFELPSPSCAPTPPGTPVSPDNMVTFSIGGRAIRRKASQSLPASPTLMRRSMMRKQSIHPNVESSTVPDSPQSVSPEPQFSPPSSLSPLEPEELPLLTYSSVPIQLSGCPLEESCIQNRTVIDNSQFNNVVVPQSHSSSSEAIIFGTKSSCAKLRRSSGESGFFSVGDRNSTCDLLLEPCSCSNDEDSIHCCYVDGKGEFEESICGDKNEIGHIGSGRKRPSSYYSDDSACCCTLANLPHNLVSESRGCSARFERNGGFLESQNEQFFSSKCSQRPCNEDSSNRTAPPALNEIYCHHAGSCDLNCSCIISCSGASSQGKSFSISKCKMDKSSLTTTCQINTEGCFHIDTLNLKEKNRTAKYMRTSPEL